METPSLKPLLSLRLCQAAAAPENRLLLRAGEPREEPEPLKVKARREPRLFPGPSAGPGLQHRGTSE